jgi:hypothetical protein
MTDTFHQIVKSQESIFILTNADFNLKMLNKYANMNLIAGQTNKRLKII